MTCLTQYFKSLYSEFIKKNKSKIEETIKEMINNIKTVIEKKQDLSIDFCVQSNNFKVKIIEFNPFGESTASGLFDWRNSTDKSIINGDLPYEFRIVEKEYQEKEHLSDEIKNILKSIENENYTNCNFCFFIILMFFLGLFVFIAYHRESFRKKNHQ
jgi:hypothetical protein